MGLHIWSKTQEKMTQIMRDKRYVNIIASGWMRAFFADYSFHPENYKLVEIEPDAVAPTEDAPPDQNVIQNCFSTVVHLIARCVGCVYGQKNQIVKVAVGIDFGSSRFRDKGTKHVMWGPH